MFGLWNERVPFLKKVTFGRKGGLRTPCTPWIRRTPAPPGSAHVIIDEEITLARADLQFIFLTKCDKVHLGTKGQLLSKCEHSRSGPATANSWCP
jgi:hypothetical protein